MAAAQARVVRDGRISLSFSGVTEESEGAREAARRLGAINNNCSLHSCTVGGLRELGEKKKVQ
jgi:hypothetical protein